MDLFKDKLPVIWHVDVLIAVDQFHESNLNRFFVALEDAYFSYVTFMLFKLDLVLLLKEGLKVAKNFRGQGLW
jgi:hypothetical protein